MKVMKKYSKKDVCAYCGTTNGHRENCPLRSINDHINAEVAKMKYEIATIEGSDGERIIIGLDDDHRLCASNGDSIHPKSSSYSDLFSARG